MRILLLLLLGINLLPVCSAYAITISNLSGTAQSIDVWENGAFKPQSIEANRNLYVYSDAKVRYAGNEKTLEAPHEYVIWENGIFIKQKSNKR